MNTHKLTRLTKRLAIFIGIAILVISMYLSFDGFDGEVSGQNASYQFIGVVIGIVFAISVTIIQFIFTSEYSKLNPTLFVIGILSYVYSIWTNHLGAENILEMTSAMSWITAAFADIVAEPMIAWGLGESLVGDLLGNMWKGFSGEDSKPQKSNYVAKHKPNHLVGNNKGKKRPTSRGPSELRSFMGSEEKDFFKQLSEHEEKK
jgi:hypothetical protein